jgi:hypothetical protein
MRLQTFVRASTMEALAFTRQMFFGSLTLLAPAFAIQTHYREHVFESVLRDAAWSIRVSPE